MGKKRYSVLTFIFGGYENVREVQNPDPEAEYILITDDATLKSDTWHIITDERLDSMGVIDKCYYVRYHPFEYCNTELCFRIDGSILVKSSLAPIIDAFESENADLMIMLNPVHNHLHEDYAQWIRTRGYPQDNADKALKMLNSLGYDSTYKGYYQIGVSLERNNEATRELDTQTYSMLKTLGTREQIERFDQPIWSFVLNKYFENRIKIMPVSEYLITASQYLQWCWHNSSDIIPFKTSMKPPYLFNRLVEYRNFDKITTTPQGIPNRFMLDEIARLRNEVEESASMQRQTSAYYEQSLCDMREKLKRQESIIAEKERETAALSVEIRRLTTMLNTSVKECEALRNPKNNNLGDTLQHPTIKTNKKVIEK